MQTAGGIAARLFPTICATVRAGIYKRCSHEEGRDDTIANPMITFPASARTTVPEQAAQPFRHIETILACDAVETRERSDDPQGFALAPSPGRRDPTNEYGVALQERRIDRQVRRP